MKRIFLTSGIVLCMACPAFAVSDNLTNSSQCDDPTLGASEQGATVQVEAKWSANKSGAISLVSSIYPSNNHSETALYTGANNDGLTVASPTPVYSVYNTGMYSDSTATTAITELSTDPSKTGYIFNGFYTADGNTQVIDNTGAFTADAKNQITSIGGTATWYANWTPKQYNISYYVGAHGSSTATPNPVNPVTYTNGLTYDATWTTKTYAENNFSADDGYTFTGWNSAQDGNGTSYAANTLQSAWQSDSALALYAMYSANQYTISYAPGQAGSHATTPTNYVTGETASTTGVDYDDTNISLAANGFSATGYHFTGWLSEYDLEDGSHDDTTYSSGGTISQYRHPNSIELTAQWAPNVTTISYSCMMDNTVDGNSQSVYTGTAPTATGVSATYDDNFAFAANPGTNPCARTGWTFDGWTCKAGGTGNDLTMAQVFGTTGDHASDTVLPAGGTAAAWLYEGADAGTISCVAHYTANTINVNWYYDANAETPLDANQCTYDGTVTLPEEPEKTGYTFGGWKVGRTTSQN